MLDCDTSTRGVHYESKAQAPFWCVQKALHMQDNRAERVGRTHYIVCRAWLSLELVLGL